MPCVLARACLCVHAFVRVRVRECTRTVRHVDAHTCSMWTRACAVCTYRTCRLPAAAMTKSHEQLLNDWSWVCRASSDAVRAQLHECAWMNTRVNRKPASGLAHVPSGEGAACAAGTLHALCGEM